jgi:hypothetical protein
VDTALRLAPFVASIREASEDDWREALILAQRARGWHWHERRQLWALTLWDALVFREVARATRLGSGMWVWSRAEADGRGWYVGPTEYASLAKCQRDAEKQVMAQGACIPWLAEADPFARVPEIDEDGADGGTDRGGRR